MRNLDTEAQVCFTWCLTWLQSGCLSGRLSEQALKSNNLSNSSRTMALKRIAPYQVSWVADGSRRASDILQGRTGLAE